jgi:hypothetical protein
MCAVGTLLMEFCSMWHKSFLVGMFFSEDAISAVICKLCFKDANRKFCKRFEFD